MKKILLALLAALPLAASAQLVGGNANLLSDAASISPWGGLSAWSTAGTNETFTANYAAGPGSSGTQATRIQLGNASYLSGSLGDQIYSYTPSSTYTFSIYVRETTAGSSNGILLHDPNNGNWPALSTTWQRYSFQVTSPASGGWGIYNIWSMPMNPGNTLDVLMWGAKLELGSSATGAPPGSSQAATPTFSPTPGTYGTTQTVTMACASPSPTIYYTNDGSTPTHSSSVYSTGISTTTTKTYKAICASAGLTDSSVAVGTYTIGTGTTGGGWGWSRLFRGFLPHPRRDAGPASVDHQLRRGTYDDQQRLDEYALLDTRRRRPHLPLD